MKASSVRITREWLEARCTQKDEHLLWKLTTHAGCPRGSANGGQFSVRLAAWTLHNGKPPPPGMTARPCCGQELCLGKECLELIPHGGYNRGQQRSLAVRKKNAEALRALKGLPVDVVQAIRASDKPPKQIAADLGVKVEAVRDIRSGRRWADFSNPYMQLGAR